MPSPKKPKPKPAAPRTDTPGLVQVTAERLRERILSRDPGAQIGSLTSLANELEVGIVTVQQAARVLEHQGLLVVKRGPGGGYYGTRPDAASLGRSLGAYIRLHDFNFAEVLELMSLLDDEMMATASRSTDEEAHGRLQVLSDRLNPQIDMEERLQFEVEFRDIIFRMIKRPMFELIYRIAMEQYLQAPRAPLLAEDGGVHVWIEGRRRVIAAILRRDEELARFESGRLRKQLLLRLGN